MTSDLAPCCACGGARAVHTIVMLDVKGPLEGRGWGCVVCGLPNDGALAVLCDVCVEAGAAPRVACAGWVRDPARIAVAELTTPHAHDRAKHPPDDFPGHGGGDG